jgi:hypothetical protein
MSLISIFEKSSVIQKEKEPMLPVSLEAAAPSALL